MGTQNARKLLARLEARSLSLAESKPPRANIGTSFDALQHAPPRTPEWTRRQRIIDALRFHLWGRTSRIHANTPTKSLRDPEAIENIDIAGALAFAMARPEGKITRAALRRQLAVAVYSFRNWPSFAAQHIEAMQIWSRASVIGFCESSPHAPWMHQARSHKRFAHIVLKIADVAVDEFMRPEHCSYCGGHGAEQTGPRVGQSCSHCGGAGLIPWSAYERARAVRVRKQDWGKVWSIPYLRTLDKLLELERAGANMHRHAMDDSDDDG